VTGRLPAVCGALALLLAPALTACSAEGAPEAFPSGSTTAGQLTVVAVGDSVTAADSPDFTRGSFGPGSWVPSAEGNGVDLTGGWAVPGATTADMRDGVVPLHADAVVVMAGTNDVRSDVRWDQSAAALDGIVDTVGVDRVLLCSIVPLAENPAAAVEFNSRLEALADEKGWEFVDSGADVRGPAGTWLPGMTEDGIHPTTAGAARIGAAVHEALVG
jgi:lysophospholipase L1-like esterase